MSPPKEPSIWKTWLSDPGMIGAESWLELVYITAGAIAAIIAILQLRKNVLQARATFLLQLDNKWDRLIKPRKEARKMRDYVRELVFSEHGDRNELEQERQLRLCYKKYLEDLQKNHTDQFTQMCEYWGFHEIIGLKVRRGYIPFRDAYLLYKGPLVEIERACTDFIQEWQKGSHIPSGLYENMLRIAKRARRRERIENALASLKFWRKE